mgnify:CR=1 FL=1
MIDLSKEKLELTYPCNWIYKVIGSNEEDVKAAVKEVVDRAEYTLKESHTSKKGKFKSFTLEVLVHNEDDRKTLYEILCAHEKIKMVL